MRNGLESWDAMLAEDVAAEVFLRGDSGGVKGDI